MSFALAALLAASSLQLIGSLPVMARQAAHFPEAKGLGPKPYLDGDCRSPNPDAPPNGEMCIEQSRLGTLSVSPKVSHGCRKGQSCGSVSANFTPTDLGAYWTIGGFGECTDHFTDSPDTPGGRKGGNSCVLKNPGGTAGWTKVTATASGACGSVAAAKSGHTEFAICLSALSSDYYAVIPPGVGAVDGTVMEDDGKTPLVGVAVLIQSEDGRKRSVATTDATGYYSAFLDPGTYSVCPCLFKDDRLNQGPGDHFQPESARVTVGETYVTKNFVQHGVDYSGQVVRKNPRPKDVPLAGVHIGFFGKLGTYREAITDKHGRYRITLPPEAYVVRGITPPPMVEGEYVGGADYNCRLGGVTQSTDICLLDGTANRTDVDLVFDNNLKLTLDRGSKSLFPDRNVHEIVAHVTDQKGNPVKGAKVHFTASTKNGQVLLGTPDGGAVWPRALLDPASPNDGLPASGFDQATDSQGLVVLDEWKEDGPLGGHPHRELARGAAGFDFRYCRPRVGHLPALPLPCRHPPLGGATGPAYAHRHGQGHVHPRARGRGGGRPGAGQHR